MYSKNSDANPPSDIHELTLHDPRSDDELDRKIMELLEGLLGEAQTPDLCTQESQDLSMVETDYKIWHFKKISTKCPSLQINPAIAIFTQQVAKDFTKIKRQLNNPEQGLPIRLRQALNQMKANAEITIKPADKGGNVVVMDNRAYVEMCMRILQNKSWYRRVSGTCVQQYSAEFHGIVDQALLSMTIDRNMWEYIRTVDPKTPTFYALPKIHKIDIISAWETYSVRHWLSNRKSK